MNRSYCPWRTEVADLNLFSFRTGEPGRETSAVRSLRMRLGSTSERDSVSEMNGCSNETNQGEGTLRSTERTNESEPRGRAHDRASKRRGGDSNPRTRSTPVTRFPVAPVQPLRHLSWVCDLGYRGDGSQGGVPSGLAGRWVDGVGRHSADAVGPGSPDCRRSRRPRPSGRVFVFWGSPRLGAAAVCPLRGCAENSPRTSCLSGWR